ncbi:MAG: glycoside hydrolase family 3 C-terminal domain-containing protein [Lachnospiraceae bacterium]|nr:glycoside hydrolase family 3 C-terminal domain-containing protein [Lachnospiraceae bacterium]
MGHELSKEEKIRLFNGDGSWRTYDAEGKIPSFVMSDGPHGLRKQDEENYSDLNKSRVATCFPTASAIACSFDRELVYKLGYSIGLEAQEQNVDVVLGPGVNIKRSPLCGRNFEYYSEDPFLAGSLSAEFIKGMQSLGIGTSIKHFACNNQETRRQTSNSIVSEKTLSEIYLRAFEIAVKKAKPATVMASYNKINGEYAASSEFLLTEILRKKWGYEGVVVSDWGACIDAPKCLKAGMDLAMPDSLGYIGKQIEKVYDEDEIVREKLEESNERIINTALKWKAKNTGDNNSSTKENAALFKKNNIKKLNHLTAVQMACECAVLLKNDGILPLKEKRPVTVIGKLSEVMKFQGGGSSHITTENYPSALECIKEKGYETEYAEGYPLVRKAKNIKALKEEAIQLVKKSVEEKRPVIYFCGLTEDYEGEGFDRTTLALPKEQTDLLDEMIALGAEVIVVTFSGAPIDLYFEDDVKAILHMYLCGEGCGEATAKLLAGCVNPSGKLAETFPYSIEDTPAFENFGKQDDNVEYKEGCFVGYRHYEGKNIPVRFEFGHGLSYTQFEYKDYSVDIHSGKVKVKIENTGDAAGAETAMVFIQKEGGYYPELRGFEKVYLEPGESEALEIALDDNSFKEYDLISHSFKIVPGNYKIMIGRSVKNTEYTVEVTVDEDFRFCKEIKSEEGTVIAHNYGALIDHTDYVPDEELYKEFFANQRVVPHTKGNYTLADNMGDMAKDSLRVRMLLGILEKGILLTSKGKSKDDPSIKIIFSALRENPLESLISTGGGLIKESFVRKLVNMANH